ncbi:hypothetical protein G7Y89_g8479 [Cudoniella acicularis]|uniref:HTH APSES-type domain-containing protein n=1 Tax=Cudoniella acicularis TaxID=354080 RepID=A0A8H4W111_9HELO|nr:hypothetical protein G7Y89_g8479 [Cudoniella acicularis]
MTTHENAETKFVTVNGIRLAYRQLGLDTGIPLTMLMHFRGNMDFWDPALINALAKSRPIILLDNAGIGNSDGDVPTSLHGWATHVVALLDALNIKQTDLLGFSMGGGAAQHVALLAPGLIRRLILAGTRTSRTPNTIIGPRDIFAELANAETEAEFKAAIALSFFNPDPHGQAAAQVSWDRIKSRSHGRAPHLSVELAKRQIEAFSKFTEPHPLNPYERIRELALPVFVANGDNDLLILTINSVELARILPHGHLHIYPNSGHGFLYQYAELFAKHIDLFLDGEDDGMAFGGKQEIAAQLRHPSKPPRSACLSSQQLKMVKPTVAGVYSATYSNIPVYEYQFGEGLKEHVMRRRHDDWINATHILKAAGFDKPARTRILEREVQKENHEKVQGGYGKYQGTWVSLEQGEALAQRNNVYEKLRPIFEFIPGNISPPPAPKHTTNKPKVPKKPAVPKWGSMAPPARVIEEEYDNISAQLNDDESVADDVTVASASFMAEDDRYDVSQASTGHRKRKRDENAQNIIDQAHVAYADELLDYFMTSNLAPSAPRPEPPLNFQPDWTIDQDGHTAMHWAAAMGDVDVMRQLKKFGANLAVQNVRGETPLMRAVLFTNCKDKQSMPQVVKELLSTIEAVDYCQATVLHHAAASTASLSKHKPARYYLDVILNKMQEVCTPDQMQRILDAQDIDGNTAIHIAAKNGARKSIRAFLGRGTRTDIPNNERVTAEVLIQEVNDRTMRDLHQGSSSPYAPLNTPHYLSGAQDENENNWNESYGTPQRNMRKVKAPAHFSEAAMSVEKKIYPLMQEKFGELARSFDEELVEKETSEKEAIRIVRTVHTEIEDIQERINAHRLAEESEEAKAAQKAQLEQAEHMITSLIEQQQQLQLISRANHEESKANGHAMTNEDDLVERAMLAKFLAEEQNKRQKLVLQYRNALSVAGDIGEMGDIYRKIIAESVDIDVSAIEGEIDILLEAMQEEDRCMRAGEEM